MYNYNYVSGTVSPLFNVMNFVATFSNERPPEIWLYPVNIFLYFYKNIFLYTTFYRGNPPHMFSSSLRYRGRYILPAFL